MGFDRGPGFVAMLRQGQAVRVERCQPRPPTLEPGRATRPSPYARFRAVGSSEEGEGEGSLTRSGCASISV
jgi:hypothetical protein